jgi:rhodanese-related sulfurtransferase
MLIDLRTPPEFEAGTINGAVMINFLDSDIDQQLDKLDRNKSYYVFCEQGARSKKCMDKMKGMGFKRVYNLVGGYNEMMGKK